MGQVHSDDYQLDGQTEDVADSEINSTKDLSTTTTQVEKKQTGTEAAVKESTLSAAPVSRKFDFKNQDTKCSSTNTTAAAAAATTTCKSTVREQQDHDIRKLSSVSYRNIQLLSMKPRSEKDAFADDLRTRRRSSLINLILGAPSSGPRFSDDLCSLSSHISECNFGIEFFSDTYHTTISVASLRLESIEDTERGESTANKIGALPRSVAIEKRRRSSVGSLESQTALPSDAVKLGVDKPAIDSKKLAPSALAAQQHFRKPSLASTLASIDLTSSFEQHEKSSSGRILSNQFYRQPLGKLKQPIAEYLADEESTRTKDATNNRAAKGRISHSGRVLRRTGSELSLYSTVSASRGASNQRSSVSSATTNSSTKKLADPRGETKLIIMLQVCLPFILAGFGNMAAGLVLNRVAQWKAFHQAPIFFVLLPPFVGLKGNIEMTLASRLSTLSNLHLLDSSYQRKRAYISNLVLVLSQAIGLSCFAVTASILCEFLMSSGTSFHLAKLPILAIFASALATSILLVVLSSIVMSLSIGLANLIQVNPDNLSTLIAALYGDVSCVLVYGLISDLMFDLWETNHVVGQRIMISTILTIWPILLYTAYRFKETHGIALASIPPMLTSIIISISSGAVLSIVVSRYKLIALYQPVVNGFGANLIAVQASRVSTWLWCSELRKLSISRDPNIDIPKKTLGSLASFTVPEVKPTEEKASRPSLLKLTAKLIRTVLWSFFNSSPNSIAARLLLVMMIPAHTIYFFAIWLLSPANYIVITWQFYFMYICLCLLQVFILLAICEPLMTLLMKRHMDPDIFGISILMAFADSIGTLCLTGAFIILARMGDVNALVKDEL